MVLFFSKKQVTHFSWLINRQSIGYNNAWFSVNKNKIARRDLIAKPQYFEWWGWPASIDFPEKTILKDFPDTGLRRWKKRAFWKFKQKRSKIPWQCQYGEAFEAFQNGYLRLKTANFSRLKRVANSSSLLHKLNPWKLQQY